MTASDHQPVLSPSQALEFIADAGEVLRARSTTSRRCAASPQLAVPEIADWCAVYVVGDDEPDEARSPAATPTRRSRRCCSSIRRRRREATAPRSRGEVGEPASRSSPPTSARRGARLEPAERRAHRPARAEVVHARAARRARRALGSLTLLSTREGRHYTEADLAFAQTLASRCALAIDNARLHDDAERSLSLLDTVFATAPVGLAFVDCDLRFVRINEAMAAYRPIRSTSGARPEVLVLRARSCLDSRRVRIRRATATMPSRRTGPALDRLVHAGPRARRRHARRQRGGHRRHRAPAAARQRARGARARRLPRARRRRCSTSRWTTSARCPPSPTSPFPRSPTGAGSASSTATACCTRWSPRTSTPRSASSARSSTAASRPSAPQEHRPTRVARTGETEFVREVTDEMLVAGIPRPRAARARPRAWACAR